MDRLLNQIQTIKLMVLHWFQALNKCIIITLVLLKNETMAVDPWLMYNFLYLSSSTVYVWLEMTRRVLKHVISPQCLFRLCLFLSKIHCEERYMLFSKSETSVTKISSLALFNIKGVSLIRCGSLCLEDHCCKEFKYSQESRRCVGIQFKDFKSTINTHSVITGNDVMSTFHKGTNVLFVLSLCLILSLLH